MATGSKEERLLVVGLDFGTTYSGYAYSFNHEYSTNRLKIHVARLKQKEGGCNSYKIPTVVLFPHPCPDDDDVYFGYEAERKFEELNMDKKSDGWLLFRHFKMKLYHEKNLCRETVLESVCGVQHKALDVFSKAIGYFKRHLMKSIQKAVADITMDDISWLITVPAIWNDTAKQFMMEAAHEAGIQKDHLMLALEPEAASLYCRILPIDKREDFGKQISASQSGTKFLTLDIGGGTVDVTVHQIESDGRLEEIHKASGGAWGGTKVDEEFIRKLQQYCGQGTFDEFARKHPSDLLDLLHSFEQAKRSTTEELDSEWIAIVIPPGLRCKWDRNCINPEYKWSGDKVRLKRDIFKELFGDSIQSIINHLNVLFQNPALENLDAMFLVGGYSECKILQDAIKHEFQHRVQTILVPIDPGLAVMQGAVLYGHDPSMIFKRVSRHTYGVNTYSHFDPAIHSLTKKRVVEGEEKCKDIFFTFLKVDHTYECGNEIHNIFSPLTSDQTAVKFDVYISPHIDVKYITDPDCTKIGCLRLKMPDTTAGKDRLIDVTFIVGGTYLDVEAKDRQHGETVRAQFDFLSH